MQGSHLQNYHIACGHPLTAVLMVFPIVFAVLEVCTCILRVHLKPLIEVMDTHGYKINLPKDQKSKESSFSFIFIASKMDRLWILLNLSFFFIRDLTAESLSRATVQHWSTLDPHYHAYFWHDHLEQLRHPIHQVSLSVNGENTASLREALWYQINWGVWSMCISIYAEEALCRNS